MIIVLSLLFSGSANAKQYIYTFKNYYDMSVSGVGVHKKQLTSYNIAKSKCEEQSKKKNLKPIGCLEHDQQEKSGMAELMNRAEKYIVWNSSVEKFEKTLKTNEIIPAIKYETKKEKRERKSAEKEKIELAKMIDKAKTTCQTLGFKKDTDKFSDCTLRLYSQEVDNKVALEVAKQKSSSSSNSGTMVIYDPVRDRQNKIDKGMEMITGRCRLGYDC